MRNTKKRERLQPWERLVCAAIAIADADSEDDRDYRVKAHYLRRAARRYVAQVPESEDAP